MALSVTTTLPLRVPVVVGVNVTLIWQFVPADRVAGQVFVCAKSPVAAIPEIETDTVPVLVRVIPRGEDVWPTSWLANLRDAGLKEMVGSPAGVGRRIHRLFPCVNSEMESP